MIRNLTKSILEMIPGLFSNSPRLKNGVIEELHLRTAYVENGTPTTYVVPGDWPEDPKHWFTADVPRWPVRDDNNVEYFVDGEDTYEAMVEAMETATSADHFIVLLGWTLHVDFVLSKSGKRSAGAKDRFLIDILKEQVGRGVQLRVLLYDNYMADGAFAPPVYSSAKTIVGLEQPRPSVLSTAQILVILDQGYRGIDGCHHQKILIINGSQGLIAFAGGIDFHPDRVGAVSGGSSLHDVHARITGSAAEDLFSLATDRWNNSSPNPKGPDIPPHSTIYSRGIDMYDMRLMRDSVARSAPAAEPHRVVKINQTIGNPATARFQTSGLWAAVQRAVREARDFIYIEDQYLWSIDLVMELAAATNKATFRHIIILIPPDNEVAYVSARHAALKKLKEICGDGWRKIGIYTLRSSGHSYVHSKTLIVDDQLAIVGSANANNRGYFNDSEVHCVIADPMWTSPTSAWKNKWWQLDLTLARKLRMELWSEHLSLGMEELVDGTASAVHWHAPPIGAHIVQYEIDQKTWYEYVYDKYYVIDDVADPRP